MIKFDFDDILIIPKSVTRIDTRSNIQIHRNNGYLPLFTAPMDTVIDSGNRWQFNQNKINSILPRQLEAEIDLTNENQWKAYSLLQADELFIFNDYNSTQKQYVLIDVANGHMPSVGKLVTDIKAKYGNLVTLMVGNVANPESYRLLSELGAEYIRVGIGNGGGCLTTVQTGVGYPLASLINECYQISLQIKSPAKIIADGGFKKYADIIKALALGADFVMLGTVFNKALESTGKTVTDLGNVINQHSEEALSMFNSGCSLFKEFRGMSTKEVQSSWGNTQLKTSEGVVRTHKVEYTLSGWVENFTHYLKSAMSYTDSLSLDEFIGKAEFIQITGNAFNRFNK